MPLSTFKPLKQNFILRGIDLCISNSTYLQHKHPIQPLCYDIKYQPLRHQAAVELDTNRIILDLFASAHLQY